MRSRNVPRSAPNRQSSALLAQANALERAGQVDAAREVYEKLLRLDRRNIALLMKLGILASHQADLHGGASYFRQAVKLNPGDPVIRNNLATVLIQLGRPDQAEEQALASLKEKPDWVETLRILFECANHLGRPEQARAWLDKALALKPDDPKLLMSMAHSYDMAAEPDKARETYQRLIDSGYSEAQAYNALARVQTWSVEPPELARIESLISTRPMSKFDKALLHQTAGKLLTDLGRHGDAFAHFAAGRVLLTAFGQGQGALPANQLDRLKEVFTPKFFADRAEFGSKSRRPVFIFGMPRSGTTLIEQILASHPKAHGAGELRFFGHEVTRMTDRNRDAEHIAKAARGLTRMASQEIARDYLELLSAYSPDAERITDKMPHNFERLWLLALAFPQASFIHCRRDPVATCVSCFTQALNHYHGYAGDLTTLGRYYHSYADLMDFWRETLPVKMLEVDYESLVRDQEAQTRRIVDHVGLEWDDACLRFHETKRSVQTPSRRQVEQPMHTKAIDGWRRYEPWLGPLFEALGERPPAAKAD